jgi:hypothetical protein
MGYTDTDTNTNFRYETPRNRYEYEYGRVAGHLRAERYGCRMSCTHYEYERMLDTSRRYEYENGVYGYGYGYEWKPF